ncbi:MAG: ABC transporter substrate-binding protein [Zoogloeaceae bacterium]|jgi:TRAP transporter TAXI family solute receptor|nr:ABC transporter substrate-binding protein [Zoogloeaceae bacterium]
MSAPAENGRRAYKNAKLKAARLKQRARERCLILRESFSAFWPFLLLVAIGCGTAFYFVQPAPPKHLIITTGREDGQYYEFAQRYREFFAANGVALEIHSSQGSRENLRRLRENEAQIAFVQGGSAAKVKKKEGLASLGSAFYEPLWIFTRGRLPFGKLTELRGKRVTVIQESKSARALAYRLLSANELGEEDVTFVQIDALEAANALQQGRLDALMVVAAPESPVVQVLLRSPGVRLMNVAQAEAYHRLFPYLFRITMPMGAADLARDYPPEDTELLAATANLVVRDDLHPALQTLMLSALRETHGDNGFFQARGDFPAYKDSDFPLSSAAERFYASGGPPFLQRYMPFWLAVLLDRFLILIIPVITLLLPLMRFAPALYHWRVRSRIVRAYGELKLIENELEQGRETLDAAVRQDLLRRLDVIETAAGRLPIPTRFSDWLYTLKTHIQLVRKKALR